MKKFSLPKDGGLIEAGLSRGILHSYERIPAHVYEDEEIASSRIADEVVDAVNSAQGTFKLGLTTGSSPVALYKELAKRHSEGKVSFSNVEIFSIDEYFPAPADQFSRNSRLYEDFLAHVDVKPENVHIPKYDGSCGNVSDLNTAFDAKATGLDLLIMGVGEKGQVGFNEPGTSEKRDRKSVV